MTKSIILIHGSYYRKNFGDYLLIKRLVNEFDSHSVRLPFASKDVLAEFENIKPMKFMELFSVKFCIFGGGGYLGEPPENITKWSIGFIKRHFMPFIILKFFRIPIRIVGTGFGPISSSWLKPFIRLMLKKSDKVLLRDIESIEYAREIAPAVNYQLVTDLAQDKIFLDSELSAIKLKLPKKYIAIHVGVKPDSNLEFDILSELKELQLKKISIIFFSDSPGHNDNLIQHNVAFKELLKKSDNSVISIPYTDASEVINIIANATVILTGKLHVGIISCTYDVPVLSIPLHHKTERYYKHIENEQFCLCANDSFEIRKTKVKSFFNNIEEHTKPILKDKIMQSHAYAISEAIVE